MRPVAGKKWKIFGLVGTSIFMSTLDSSIVNVALPYMMQSLGTRLEIIQWVVLVYLLTVSALLLTFGRLSDIMGRRKVYVAGFSIFTIGSLFCALSTTSALLIFSRAVQGLGASMLMACSPALIIDVFEPRERGRALGMMGAVVAAGLTVGPVAGGVILQLLSWRFIFYINLPIGIIAAFLGFKLLSGKETDSGSNEPMDMLGSLLLIVFLSSLMLFLTQLPRWGFLSVNSISLFITGVISAVLFQVHEKRVKHPLFDPDLLKIRLFVFPVASSAILFAALFIIIFLMPFYLTYPCGFSASKTGLIMIVPFSFLLILSPVAGSLYDRYRSRRLCLFGMGLLTLSLAVLSGLTPSDGLWGIVWRISLAGAGTAFFVSPNNTAGMSSVPLNRRGIASGAVATSRNIGMVFGVAMAGLVFTLRFANLSGGMTLENYNPAMQPFFMAGFRSAMLVGACLAGAGLIVTWARGSEAIPAVKTDKGDPIK